MSLRSILDIGPTTFFMGHKAKTRWLSGCMVVCLLACILISGSKNRVDSELGPFSKTLTFGVYRFQIAGVDNGPGRQLRVEASRGSSLLTAFHLPIDRPVVAAQVADLDQNHFPEIYIFLSSNGTGSLGNVMGWQFLSQRKADIKAADWGFKDGSYMGHDTLWIEEGVLCRRFPLYRSGDANAEPSGGVRTIRYRLQEAGEHFILKAEKIE